MFNILAAAFATGVLSKVVDLAEEHGMKMPRAASRISGIVYGMLIAYVISVSPELSGLWIAAVIGTVVTGKIDTTGHYLGLGAMLFFMPVLGIAGVNIYHLLIFTASATADEIADGFAERGRIKGKAWFLRFRPLLEISAFLVALVSWQWIIWLGIAFFDAGYTLTGMVAGRD